MIIAIASDHAGFPLKTMVIKTVQAIGHEVIDLGVDNGNVCVDYPDYAEKVGRLIQNRKADRGILLCGSGVGACIAVNKMKGNYGGVCHDTYSAHQAVEHDNMNVICLGARVIGDELAREIVQAFLSAHYIGEQAGQERHARRVAKLHDLEKSG
jgi:ribose 5-phosphate isomerase B